MEKYYFRPHNVKTFTGKTWHGHANQPNIVPYVHKQQHSVFCHTTQRFIEKSSFNSFKNTWIAYVDNPSYQFEQRG